MRTAVLLSLGLTACGDPTFPTNGGGGVQVWRMFPFDGERQWKYVSTDSALPHKIVATSDGLAETMNGKNVYTVHYKVECVNQNDENCVTGQELFVLRWSSDTSNGVYIHAYSVGDVLQFINFDPPLRLTYDDMGADDVIETETNSQLWTSTMGQITDCPMRMSGDFDNCGTWTVEVNQGDGFPIAGQWWAAESLGVASFQLTTDSGQWQLAQPPTCAGDCDGGW